MDQTNRTGEKIGWIGGWLGGFIWVTALALMFLFQTKWMEGVTGLLIAGVAVTAIVFFAPWRHPSTYYWKLMLPLYAMFYASAAWAIWAFGGLKDSGLNWWNFVWLLPMLTPFFILSRRTWDDLGGQPHSLPSAVKPKPPAPPGWNKTIDDLVEEAKRGERSSIGSPETDWARDYERSLIPADMRFPRKGDVYEALEDMTLDYLTAWKRPYTGGGQGLLKKGEQVVIDTDPGDDRPISVYAKAVDYETIEKRMVPASERKASAYGGFYFSFKAIDLNRKFKLIREE